MHKKFYIKTWGCQMNEYDSLTISNILQEKLQYVQTDNVNESDILILNTCSVREKAQEKLFHQLGRWKYLKNHNKNIIIAIGGCVANQEGKNIIKRSKLVDIIFGTQTLHRLPELINQHIQKKKNIIDITFPKMEKFKNIKESIPQTYTTSISIIEGCNKYCSFCIVPYTRGREMSRPFYNIINEIKLLSQHGVKEIQLLGQNVNSYKYIDTNGKKYAFSDLLKKISDINNIDRIKFITSNPMDFTDDIIDAFQYTDKIVNFLHLPIQSGSNRILKLMKRPYSVKQYEKIIEKLKIVRPKIQISSDFIVGFPGETENDFEETMQIISKINFDMSYSFIYSPRPGTPASKLKDNTSITEKKNRLYILQKKIKQQALMWTKSMINSVQKVLVLENFNQLKNNFLGKTENNRTVLLKSKKNILGNIIETRIISFNNHTLYGEYIS